MKYLICFYFLSFNISLYAQNIKFYDAGKEIKSLKLDVMKKNFKVHTIEVYDQVLHNMKRYKAFSTNEVFTKIYGNSWKNKEEIEFTCADGYKPSFDSSILNKGSSYLAFSYVL